MMDPSMLVGLAALGTAAVAVFRQWSQRSLNKSEEAVNWESIANRAMANLEAERGEHSRQLSQMQRSREVDSERLEICEERWQLVDPLLKTWSKGRDLETQIVDRISELTARAETLKATAEAETRAGQP